MIKNYKIIHHFLLWKNYKFYKKKDFNTIDFLKNRK